MLLPGSVSGAKSDPGVPYTYAHTYILRGSVLAAKGDPRVPYTYTHTYIFPGSVLAAKGDPRVPLLIRIHYLDQFWLQKVIRAYLMHIHMFIRKLPGLDQFWQ